MKTTHIEFKPGVHVRLSHFEDAPQRILRAALLVAPPTTDGRVVVTEGWRQPRHARDLHNMCLAWDLRIHNLEVAPGDHDEEYGRRLTAAWGWVNAMRDVHDDDRFQFDVHGQAMNVHIHAEFDPRR